jgi:hypothetical protein
MNLHNKKEINKKIKKSIEESIFLKRKINKFSNKIITVFSGKWNTAIGLAKFLLKNKKVFR